MTFAARTYLSAVISTEPSVHVEPLEGAGFQIPHEKFQAHECHCPVTRSEKKLHEKKFQKQEGWQYSPVREDTPVVGGGEGARGDEEERREEAEAETAQRQHDDP